MLFADVSDTVWLAIIGLFALTIKEIFDRKRANDAAEKVAKVAEKAEIISQKAEIVSVKAEIVSVKAEVVAQKAEEVKATLAQAGPKTEETLNAIHVLVNNKMEIQLRLNAGAMRRLAILTKDKIDVEAADLADQLVKDHMDKQAIVDKGTKI